MQAPDPAAAILAVATTVRDRPKATPKRRPAPDHRDVGPAAEAAPQSAALVLILLAAVAALGALIAVTGRGAFIDEAIYMVAGRTLVFHGENWRYTEWFNGSPFTFSVLAGVIQRLGGDLVAVRLMNVGFLVLAVWAVYKMGVALRLPSPAPLLGAAAFGLAGPALFTGAFATYDTPAIAFSAIAFWLAIRGTSDARVSPVPLLLAGLAFAVAVLFKYVTIATAPAFLSLIAARLGPLERPLSLRGWWPALAGAALATAPAVLVVGPYALAFRRELGILIAFQGFHLTSYGATGPAILWTVLLYIGPAWLVALIGLERLLPDRRLFLTGLVLVGGSLIMPLYHLLKVDPLALFKQMGWSLALLGPLMGVALASLLARRRLFALVATFLLLFSLYHVVTLRAFYPDTRPPADWLRARIDASVDPILVDNGWVYRYELANLFDGREWWVAEQWWWPNYQDDLARWQVASAALWRDLLQQRTFSYVIFERGGAWSGHGSVFDASVIDTLEHSGHYRLVARFPSRVTWGNSIMPPPFPGELRAYDVVSIEVWERIP